MQRRLSKLEIAKQRSEEFKRAEARLLEALVDVEKDRAYEEVEHAHLTPYCTRELGLSPQIAAAFVRVVKKHKDVPDLVDAVLKGDVTLHKAKVIASVVTRDNCDAWLEKARTLPKNKLEHAVADASGLKTREVTHYYPHSTYDKLQRNQDLLCTKLQRAVSEEETIEWALEENLERFDPIRRAKRSKGQSLDHQISLRDEDCCQHIMPDGTRCGSRRWLQRHHIIPKSQGGPDTLENLVTLCASHHRMIHRSH